MKYIKNIKTNEIIFTSVFFKIYHKILKKDYFKLLLKRIKNMYKIVKGGGIQKRSLWTGPY